MYGLIWRIRTGDSLGLTAEELAVSYHGAWVQRDPEAISALLSADSVFHMHGAAEPATGKRAVRDLIAALLHLVPDLEFEPKKVLFG